MSLNFLLPTLSWILIFDDKSTALNECLGKGYLNFFSPTLVQCPENQLGEIFCWTWLSLLSILMSNVIDVFCIFYCFKDISEATEESRKMLSKQGYINRKRYYILSIFLFRIFTTLFFFQLILSHFLEIMELQSK